MSRPALEVADIFCRHGEQYRHIHAASMSWAQRRVMRAIELCRTAALGGHRDQCDRCGYQRISFNSCRNRHCPKCQSLAKAKWLDARQKDLLAVSYFHIVFTIADAIASLALQNKRALYGILFRAASETMRTIGADPKHLGARIGFLAVLHTWGQNLLHHPHLHCLVPGGGLSPDGRRWISSRPGFFLPVRVLSRMFRGKFLAYLKQAFEQGKLQFQGKLAHLADPQAFNDFLRSARKTEWVVYSKPPFGGPSQVLDYLGRYTHRVAISNHRLVRLDNSQVTFRWKDYSRGKRIRLMTLDVDEFIRRFLLHVLPPRFMRLRHFGFLANRGRSGHLSQIRALLELADRDTAQRNLAQDWKARYEKLTGQSFDICPSCHLGRMVWIESLRSLVPLPARRRTPPAIDSS